LIQTLSSDAKLFVNNLPGGSTDGPIVFNDGTANAISGLSYDFSRLDSETDDLSFSDDNGNNFDYIPTADDEGYDSNVTHIQLVFPGSMKPKYDQGTPIFTLEYQVKVK
jgi:hypothetical protein